MKNISHGEALDVLRRTHLIPLNSEISITYIPASDAAVFKTSFLTKEAQKAQDEASTSKVKTTGERPTPAARTKSPELLLEQTTPSSTTTGKATHNNTTIISIGPSSSTTTHQVAPLVSPEAVEDTEVVKESSVKTDVAAVPTVASASVYIKAVTDDESSTDPLVNLLPSPPPPPRPSKTTPTSEDEHDSHLLTLSGGQTKTKADGGQEDVVGGEDENDDEEDETSNAFSSQHWGPERSVEISRVAGQGLGISIVGGKVDTQSTSKSGEDAALSTITGIFIKNVLENSPAGQSSQLFTGDRILEVDGHDLR